LTCQLAWNVLSTKKTTRSGEVLGPVAFHLRWLLPVAGFSGILFATVLGTGVTPDALSYLEGATNIANGNGYVRLGPCSGVFNPVQHWPPFFSIVLSAVSLLGLDALDSARWLNAFLFAANIGIAGQLVAMHVSRTSFLPALVSFFILSAFPMIETHSAAWTEPLFILLTMLGLVCTGRYLESGKSKLLLLASFAIGFSILTRYAGVATLGSCAFLVLFNSDKKWARRLMDTSWFSLLSLIPVLVFSYRNYQVSGTSATRSFQFNGNLGGHLEAMVYSFSSWVLPGADRVHVLPNQELLNGLAFVVVVLVWCWLVLWVLFGFRTYFRRSPDSRVDSSSPHRNSEKQGKGVLYALALFMVSYLLMLWSSVVFASLPPIFDNRLLSPMLIPAVILGSLGVYAWLSGELSITTRRLVGSLATVAFVIYAISGWLLYDFLHQNGRGYTGAYWDTDQIAIEVSALDSNIDLVTNQPQFVAFEFQKCSRTLGNGIAAMETSISNALEEASSPGSVYLLYYQDARQFIPIAQAAAGQVETIESDLMQALQSFEYEVLIQENQATLYHVSGLIPHSQVTK